MGFLSHVYGQTRVKAELSRLLEEGRLPHTMIFYGEEGLGKTTAALDLAGTLAGKDIFQETASWSDEAAAKAPVLTAAGDSVWYIRPSGIELRIDQLRLFLDAMPSFGGALHVCIIDEAQTMMPAAANVMLKSLEEPPENVYFILITHDLDALLPTIVSRAERFPFFPLSRADYEALAAARPEEFHFESPEALEEAFFLSEGNPGMTLEMFGESGARLVIEEYLEGPEISVLAFTDGKTLVPMLASMDHKRAYDGDEGPNTGGMGAVCPNPYYTEAVAKECMERIFLPTIRAMAAEGCPFRGCLYFGLMLTRDGPKVIEYNCRFGDPETQVVLPLLETDLLDIMEACAEGRLAELDIRWSEKSACCVVLASGGYPKAYKKGFEISGLAENGQLADGEAEAFHAGTRREGGRYYTNGGRVLGVTATGMTLAEAVERAYAAADGIGFEGLHRRGDIGARALASGR